MVCTTLFCSSVEKVVDIGYLCMEVGCSLGVDIFADDASTFEQLLDKMDMNKDKTAENIRKQRRGNIFCDKNHFPISFT